MLKYDRFLCWDQQRGCWRNTNHSQLIFSLESNKEASTKKNLKHVLDWETILALLCLMLMLFAVNTLIKLAQFPTCYGMDFISDVKICKANLYQCTLIQHIPPKVRNSSNLSPLWMTTPFTSEDWAFCQNIKDDHLLFLMLAICHT